MTVALAPFDLAVDADTEYRFHLSNPDGSPRGNLNDVTLGVSATKGGAVFTGTTKYAASEITAGSGDYKVTFPETDMTLLAPRVGWGAYAVIYEGAKVLGSDPCIIRASPLVGG